VNNSPYKETVLTGEELEVKRKKEAKGKEAKKAAKGKGTKREKKSGNHEGQRASSPKIW
jgi:hypothetical protein